MRGLLWGYPLGCGLQNPRDRAGEPWFVLADVCQVLDIGEAHVASRRLDDEDKDRFSIPTPVAARARWSD